MTANPTPDKSAQRDFDLIDLFHEIVSRWLVILACIVLFTVVGAIAVALMDRTYAFLTTIEIGHVASIDGSNRPSRQFVESPASATARLESAYIPAVTGASEDEAQAIVVARSHENVEGLIILESIAQPDSAGAIAAIHQELVNRLQLDHSRLIEAQRKAIQNDLNRLEGSIAEIDDEIGDLRAEEDRIASSRNSALKGLADISAQNASSESRVAGVVSANQTNIILERQSLLANFDRSRQDIVERRRELVDRQRSLREETALRTLALTNLRDTEAIALAVRSIEPAGPGRGLILAVSILTGIVVGVAIAIIMFLFGAIARRRAADLA